MATQDAQQSISSENFCLTLVETSNPVQLLKKVSYVAWKFDGCHGRVAEAEVYQGERSERCLKEEWC